MVTKSEKVLSGLSIVHTWASVLKERTGIPPEMCADAEVYVKRGIEMIKKQAEEIRQLKDQEPLMPVWRDGKAYCKGCGEQLRILEKPRYCQNCGKRVYSSNV